MRRGGNAIKASDVTATVITAIRYALSGASGPTESRKCSCPISARHRSSPNHGHGTEEYRLAFTDVLPACGLIGPFGRLTARKAGRPGGAHPIAASSA